MDTTRYHTAAENVIKRDISTFVIGLLILYEVKTNGGVLQMRPKQKINGLQRSLKDPMHVKLTPTNSTCTT